jgi:PAS domain S-box-containing protein
MKDIKKTGTKRVSGPSKFRKRKSAPHASKKNLKTSHDARRRQPQKPSSPLPHELRIEAGLTVGKGQTLSASVLEAIADSVTIQDTDLRIIYQNKVSKNIFGDRIGEYCYRAYHKNDRICKQCALVESFKDGKIHTIERTGKNEKGALHFEVTAAPLRNAAGAIIAGIEIGRNITERKEVERERTRLLSALERSVNEIYMFDAETLRFRYVNSGALRNLGYSRAEIESITPLDLKPEFTADSFREIIGPLLDHRKDEQIFYTKHRRADGTLYPVEVHLQLVEHEQESMFLAVIIDITERREAEEKQQKLQAQLLQAQKMEAVGQLAGGIAHDFNNILTAIIGYGNLLSMKTANDEVHRPYIDHILSAANRAASLTQGLLAFSRKQIINPQPVTVNAIIEQVQKLLHRIIGEDIELRTVLTGEDTTVMADTGQIEQVLINLAANARDAMPNGGQLTIETRPAEIGSEYLRAHGYGKAGKYILISVSDSGEGMDERTLDRIFEPFFTTKEVGKGTGLGLAIVYGSIKQHNGYINVSSEPGRGTTFTIYLPLLKAEARPATAAEPAPPPKGGTETILLAEDDAVLRDLARGMLEEFGYTVIEAVDGEDAIEKFRANQDSIQLLILDVIMPKKNGREVFEEVKKMKSGTKVLFTSGYPANIIQKKGILEAGINFIVKPHRPQELLRKIRAVLNS